MRSYEKFKVLTGIALFASLLVAALGSWTNALASGSALQDPPPVITVEPPEDDPIIPDTGEREAIDLPGGLLLWILIGLAVVLALGALIARPWYTPPPPSHTHEPPHDHPEDHYP